MKIQKILNLWRRAFNYRPGRLGKNTLAGSVGLIARSFIQAIYLLTLSRWLGAEGYGLFAGSVALAALASPIANWGSAMLLIQYVALDRTSSRGMWATALVQTGVLGGILLIATLLVSALISEKLPLEALLCLAISELILLPASHVASSQCYALQRGGAAALSVCIIPLSRTIALIGVATTEISATPPLAAFIHFFGSAIGFIAIYMLVIWIDGPPAWRKRLPFVDCTKKGSFYAISNVASINYQEVDKIFILQLLGATVVGPYTAAFRVATIFVLPISALINAALPQMMALGKINDRIKKNETILISALGYGFLAGVVIFLTSPFIPKIFGDGFEKTTDYLQILAIWPIFFALRNFLASSLTSHLKQRSRAIIEISGLAFVCILNLIFLKEFGANFAIGILIAAEILMSVILSIALKANRNKI